jgi:aminoglycoside phosphotransferase (APT) family kinase protein
MFVFYERDMMRQEPGIHALLLEKTTVPIPRIIGYDNSHSILDRDYLLMERLPGQPLSAMPHANEEAVLRELGACLAQAHALTAESYGYIGEHHPMPPQNTWKEAFVLMWRKLLDDVVTSGHYTDADRTRLLRLLDRYLPMFNRNAPACLLHMDIWSENILVSDTGVLTGIIDWDRALWGDPEIEFAILDYCNISQPAFWEGYGQTRDASSEAGIRSLFYLLYEVQKYIVICDGRNREPHVAQQYKEQSFALARRIGE